MRELGRIIRTYASCRQNQWDRIIMRAESIINTTEHRSTEYCPVDLQYNILNRLDMDPALIPEDEPGVE